MVSSDSQPLKGTLAMGQVSSVVSLLNLAQHFQRCLLIEDRPGQDSLQQQASLGYGQCWRVPLQVMSHAHQEEMSDHYQDHMVIPSPPAVHRILVHLQFIFAIFDTPLYRPASGAQPCQLRLRCFPRRVAEKVLDLLGHPIPTEDQPNLRAGQAILYGAWLVLRACHQPLKG